MVPTSPWHGGKGTVCVVDVYGGVFECVSENESMKNDVMEVEICCGPGLLEYNRVDREVTGKSDK